MSTAMSHTTLLHSASVEVGEIEDSGGQELPIAMLRSDLICRLLFVLFLGTALTGNAADLPTLKELKAAGARHTKFKQRTTSSNPGKVPQPALDLFREEVEPLLKTHCVGCHGPEKAKAHLRIDTLDPNLLAGKDVDWWLGLGRFGWHQWCGGQQVVIPRFGA